MPWPTVAVVTTGMDADTDTLPRTDILDHTQKFNQLIAMRGVASGVCDLDASALIPSARLPGVYQPLDATITALAGVTVAADQIIYATGADAFSPTAFTAFARTRAANANALAARATLELETVAQLEAEAGIATTTRTWTAERVKQAIAALSPQSSLVTLGADVINNNATANTLQDVTGLSFPVLAGSTYEFEFVIPFGSAATATGSRWALNGPALTSLVAASTAGAGVGSTTGNNPYAPAQTSLLAYETGYLGVGSSLDGNVAVLKGIITCSAAGNVIARFASEVASSAITAKAGAYVLYRKR